MDNYAKWEYLNGPEVSYIKCTSCSHKISAKRYIFADTDTTTCPFCNRKMDSNSLDYEKIYEDAINEC